MVGSLPTILLYLAEDRVTSIAARPFVNLTHKVFLITFMLTFLDHARSKTIFSGRYLLLLRQTLLQRLIRP